MVVLCLPFSFLWRVLRLRTTAWIAPCLLCLSALASAHGVHHHIRHAQAVVVTLTYDDGQAFAHAVFEAAPMTDPQAGISGQTDAMGRAVIVAETPGRWQLRAFSDDGHGVQVAFDVAVPNVNALSGTTTPRWLMGVFGLLLLLAVFAGVQWRLMRRARSTDPAA